MGGTWVQLSISEQLLQRNEKRFRGGLIFKARGWLYHSTLGSRVITKRERDLGIEGDVGVEVEGDRVVRRLRPYGRPMPRAL